MADIELVIKIPEEYYKAIMKIPTNQSTVDMLIIKNGTPLEEILNPCIECSQNCCVCELNGEKCECQKVYIVKENKE